MTDAEKDVAWRSLPEDYKVELRRKYKPYIALGEAGGINIEMLMLEDLFGKHNLTEHSYHTIQIVTEDQEMRFVPNWLTYRMSLIKEITPKVIYAVSDNGISSDFCESVIDKVTTIVDGIIERLKGGANGKV